MHASHLNANALNQGGKARQGGERRANEGALAERRPAKTKELRGVPSLVVQQEGDQQEAHPSLYERRSHFSSLLVEGDLEPQVILHVQERFGVAARIVERMMRMRRLAKVLEVHERGPREPLVERT